MSKTRMYQGHKRLSTVKPKTPVLKRGLLGIKSKLRGKEANKEGQARRKFILEQLEDLNELEKEKEVEEGKEGKD